MPNTSMHAKKLQTGITQIDTETKQMLRQKSGNNDFNSEEFCQANMKDELSEGCFHNLRKPAAE